MLPCRRLTMALRETRFLDWIRAAGAKEARCSLVASAAGSFPESVFSFEAADFVPQGNSLAIRRSLHEGIGAAYGLPADHVFAVTGGCGTANFLAARALVEPQAHVLIESPCYEPFIRIFDGLSVEISFLERRFEDGYAVDPDRLAALLRPETRLVILSSPHNPSGAVIPPETLRVVLALLEEREAYLLCDEIFLDAVDAAGICPAASLGPRAVSTGGLSKCFSMDDLRAGWVLAAPDLLFRIKRLYDAMGAFNPVLMDRLAAKVFTRFSVLREFMRQRRREQFAEVRRWMEERPDLQWVAPQGGFCLFPQLPGGLAGEAFAARLEETHGVIVVPGRLFGDDRHVRIGFGLPREKLAEGLRCIGQTLDAFKEAEGASVSGQTIK